MRSAGYVACEFHLPLRSSSFAAGVSFVEGPVDAPKFFLLL